jgi:hypothetical protein
MLRHKEIKEGKHCAQDSSINTLSGPDLDDLI